MRTILEAAWNALTFKEVVRAAERILALAGRSALEPGDERLRPYLDSPHQSLTLEDRGGSPDDGRQESPWSDQSGSGREPKPASRQAAGRVPTAPSCVNRPMARRLAAVLRPPTRPAKVTASRDRGRYRADRDMTGSERPFDLKVGGGKPGPAHLRLAVDVSFSMEIGGRIDQARRLLFVALHAAQKVEMPVIAIAFDDDMHPIRDQTTRPVTALNRAAALTVLGNTRLAPALRELWRPSLPGTSVSLIITDGHLAAADRAACRAVRDEHVQMFGRCVMIRDPAQLTAHVASFLRSQMTNRRTEQSG